MGAQVVTVDDVLDGHVALDIQCLDRIYLNAYIPRLQTSAQVVAFLSRHLGYRFPSPALFNQIGQRFRRAVACYAEANDIAWVQFGKDDDKLAVMRAHLDRQAATGKSGVAAIGVAQEFQRVWAATQGKTATGTPRWSFYKADRGSPATTSRCGTPTSAPPSSRCAPGSPIRARSGSTATSGPNAKPPRPGSASPSSPTGSPPARIHRRCRSSATGSARAPSTSSSNAGWLGCPYRSPTPTVTAATGGRLPCARSRSPAPSSSTRPATPAASSRR
jgi:hypothetical protein